MMTYKQGPVMRNGDIQAVVTISVPITKLVPVENGHGFRREPTGEHKNVDVALCVHLDSIALQLCGTAAKNKTGISREMSGLLVAKRRKS